MSLLYPIYLAVAGVVAAGVVALHFLTTAPSRPTAFPTLRFVPSAPLRASALRLKFSDLLWLLLRVATVLLIGLGFAQPRLSLFKKPVAHVVAVDISSTVARTPRWRSTVARVTQEADSIVLFDDKAREVSADELRSAIASDRAHAAALANLSGALIAAQRAGSQLRDTAEAIELIVISPFTADSFDAATASIRALWPGGIRLVRVDPASVQRPAKAVTVEWAGETASALWARRARPDTPGGVHAQAATVIAKLERKWQLSVPDPAAEGYAKGSRIKVIARWLDGEPAGVEIESADKIERSMGFSIPQEGDISLRPAVVRFKQWLQADSATSVLPELLDAEATAVLAGQGGAVKANALAPQSTMPVTTVVLLGLALTLILLEPLVRRRLRSVETRHARQE